MPRPTYWPWGIGLDKRQARRLRRRQGRALANIDRIIDAASDQLGITPLPWQRDYLRAVMTGSRGVVIGGRRAGRTTVHRLHEEAQRLLDLTPNTPTTPAKEA